MRFAFPLFVIILVYFLSGCSGNRVEQSDSMLNYETNYNLYNHANNIKSRNRDSAFVYFNQVATEAKDSILPALASVQMAIMQHDVEDFYGSQETLLSAYGRLNENNQQHKETLASIFTELGNNSRSLENYDKAINYYDSAISFSTDSDKLLTRLNNKAVVYKDKKQYDQAILLYEEVLQKSIKDPLDYARVLSNLAYVRWLKDANYPATKLLWEAMEIRRSNNYDRGLLTSYDHLCDYYGFHNKDSSRFYAEKRYRLAKILQKKDDQKEALSQLIRLNEPVSYQQRFAEFEHLSDSLNSARNKAKNQFALIRYETEKHKADKLILQKENAERKLRLIVSQVAFFLVVLVLALAFWFYRRRKQRAIRDQQLKTSQKIHDVVANGLYRIMTKIEHNDEIEKETLLDDMEILYEQSRDISYDQPMQQQHNFEESVSALLQSFSTAQTSISIVGNSDKLWTALREHTRKELKHILLELMTNMKKHSTAKNVLIRFEHKAKEFSIHYTDDGIGLPEKFKRGNGIMNTENRIYELRGDVIFENSLTGGLKIHIRIPID